MESEEFQFDYSGSWPLADLLVSNLTLGTGLKSNTTDIGYEAALAFRDLARFWIQRILVPIVVVIGVLGNVVSMVILTSRGMRSSTNLYLTALASSDSLYLLCIFYLSFTHYPGANDNSYRMYWNAQPYFYWLTDASSNTSVWITVSFTIERYIAVCYPMRRKSLCTESRAKKVIFLVFLFAFLSSCTTSFEWVVTETIDAATNTTKLNLAWSHLGKDEIYKQGYYWFTTMTFIVIPLVLLTIFNSYLIHSVRKSRRLRRQMTNEKGDDRTQNQETRITVILIAVVMLFIVCQLPTATILIYTSSFDPPPNTTSSVMLHGFGNIFNFLVSVNAACNFILYCALSDKYRKAFLRIFCSCFLSNRETLSPQHTMVSSVTYRRNSDDGHSEVIFKTRKENIYRPPRNGAIFLTAPTEQSLLGRSISSSRGFSPIRTPNSFAE